MDERKVVHFGPIGSRGGMSTVISTMLENDIEGWSSSAIRTHCEGNIIGKIRMWLSARRKLRDLIRARKIDIAHIHVTHSLSWWRKRDIMRICSNYEIPCIIHIHSGKFDVFCEGFSGNSIRKELATTNRKTIVLEKRWLKKLERWIPEDSEVIQNPCSIPSRARLKRPKKPIKFLVMSRKDEIKGHDIAIEVVGLLRNRGVESELTIIGIEDGDSIGNKSEWISLPGWVSEERKLEILDETDFVLSPSIFEGSSMSVIESISRGVPCICSEASSETVEIEDLIVDSFDPEIWSKRIEWILEEERYENIVDNLESVSKKYSSKRVMENWGVVYSQIVDGS